VILVLRDPRLSPDRLSRVHSNRKSRHRQIESTRKKTSFLILKKRIKSHLQNKML